MYLLDTDHLSFLQRETGVEFDCLQSRLATIEPSAIVSSVISFHEQIMGWNSHVQRAKRAADVIHGYEKMSRVIDEFAKMQVLSFDHDAAIEFASLRQLRVGVMDLRIASIALSRDLTLLTRNFADFEKVPNLKYEDWTVPLTSDEN